MYFIAFHSILCHYVIANSLRNHSLPTSLHHEISRMLLHLIGVVKLPELRPTCESFVLIDAINNGYNRDKNIIFNASTLNVTQCRYMQAISKNHQFFSMHISIGGFKTSENYLSDGLNSNKDQEFLMTSSPRQTTFCGSQSSKNFHLPKKRYMYNMFHLPKKTDFSKKHLFQRKSKAIIWVFPKIGKHPKRDDLFHGNPY